MKIAIVDYGTGNLRSVGQAVRAAADGADVVVTSDAAVIDAADRVVFPGQGAMGDCMRCLSESGLRDAVLRALAQKPVLAICIGMQMLLEKSEENDCAGLGLVPGKVIRFPESALTRADGTRLKVPQMGWNTVRQRMAHPLWNGIADASWFYFVHSYFVAPEHDLLRAALCVRPCQRQHLCHAVSPRKKRSLGPETFLQFRALEDLTGRPLRAQEPGGRTGAHPNATQSGLTHAFDSRYRSAARALRAPAAG